MKLTDSGITRLSIRKDYRAQDHVIVQDVYLGDCYHVAAMPADIKTVVDVGAHVGVAARKFIDRFPEAQVACVEAHPDNVEVLRHNMKMYPQAKVFAGACTYEKGPLFLHGTVYPGCPTTGGSFIGAEDAHAKLSNAHEYKDDGRIEHQFTLEQIMADMGWNYIDVLKLDCEGSELSILENAPMDRLRIVVGEWHSHEILAQIRKRFDGWVFDILRQGQLGLFRLSRPGQP